MWSEKKEELYAKQGRNTRFVDQQSRDSWIKKEISQLEGHIAARQHDLEREQEDTARLRRENSERDDAISRCRREREAHKSKWEEKNDALLQMKREKDELANKQNEHWREQTKLQADKSQLADDMRNKESKLQGMIGRSTLDGINALKRVRARFQQQNNQRLVDGYLGSLIDCFETDQAFFTAVEVTAGGRLFNHIVTDASIGTAYLDEMNRMKLSGEVTFLPLDRLVAAKENYPTDTKDALPLIDKLRFGDRYKIAMRYVFGKTLICRNIEVASKYARNKGFDCITLDGDQVSRRGALTGGYIDTSRSRLELHHLKKQHEEQIYALEDDLQRSKEDMQQFDEKMNKIQREIQNYDAELSKCKDQFDRSSRMFTQKREEYTQYLKSIESREESINHLMQQLESLSSDKKALESELGTAMASQLSAQEQEDLRRFVEALREKSKELQEITQLRIDVEKKKTRVEGILKDNLLKREAFLEAGMNSMEGDERRSRLTEAIDKYERVAGQLSQCAERESELIFNIRQHEQDRDQMFKVVEDFKRQQNHFTQELFEADKQVDTMAAKESIYIDKHKNAEKKILDLGSVPNDLIQNYADQSSKHLFKKLEDAQKALKNYGHVNKQALDQFMAFSEERARLERRRNELDGESEKITELVTYLDVKKFEAIESSFNDISKNFALVFSKLVPQGSAHLEMKEDSRKDPAKFSKVEMLSGILIKVSFSGQAAETREMSQLSGGQKSMVALTLIFAIQKCDPVPFYLFDEIDQALDPGHRRAVSEMMNEMKHDAQFITTTFRPELLESGDKFYGVTYRNKVSHVNTITKSVALDFVEDDKINS
jgi:structural maintenance of chromosome 3 (chondroitin sulfate proteoglycan 6)